MHTGCPVIKGAKWVAIKWVHAKPFRQEGFDTQPVGQLKEAYNFKENDGSSDPVACVDLHPQCKIWADAGECKANRKYMVGDASGVGSCRMACGACRPCQAGDQACRDAARKKAGFLVVDPAEMV
jgi:prolyl 4-hydroxylase